MANDIYLKIDGAPGTSTDSKHKDWIELESYSFGGNQQSTQSYGTGAGAGKVSFQDFHFTAKAGKDSPVVFGMMCGGKHIAKVTLEAMKAAGDKQALFMKITLENCFITGFQMSDAAGGGDPAGSYSLNFSKATYDYTSQSNDGSAAATVTAGWDAKENKKV